MPELAGEPRWTEDSHASVWGPGTVAMPDLPLETPWNSRCQVCKNSPSSGFRSKERKSQEMCDPTLQKPFCPAKPGLPAEASKAIAVALIFQTSLKINL